MAELQPNKQRVVYAIYRLGTHPGSLRELTPDEWALNRENLEASVRSRGTRCGGGERDLIEAGLSEAAGWRARLWGLWCRWLVRGSARERRRRRMVSRSGEWAAGAAGLWPLPIVGMPRRRWCVVDARTRGRRRRREAVPR